MVSMIIMDLECIPDDSRIQSVSIAKVCAEKETAKLTR